jgi:hypothetical protein
MIAAANTKGMRAVFLRCVAATACVAWPVAAADGPVRCGIEMRHVDLRVADDVVLHVRALDGEFVSRSPTQPPIFDDPRSYVVRMRTADLSLDSASLTNLLRTSLAARPSPLSDVTVQIENGALKANGKLRKGVSIPFSMTASVAATSDGMLRLHASKLKAVGVPIKGLLDLLGLDVADLMKMPPESGIRADGDDLLLDTSALLPPPRMEGRLVAVTAVGDRLALKMTGSGRPPPRPKTLPLANARNYLYFYGGSIRFGKLTMTDTDMQLIDANPATPFDFFPAHYEAQLVAGYSRNTPRKGLQVYMPDYARVSRKSGMLKPPRIQ